MCHCSVVPRTTFIGITQILRSRWELSCQLDKDNAELILAVCIISLYSNCSLSKQIFWDTNVYIGQIHVRVFCNTKKRNSVVTITGHGYRKKRKIKVPSHAKDFNIINNKKFLHSVFSQPQPKKSPKKVEFSHEKFFIGHPWTIQAPVGDRWDNQEKEQFLY